MVFLYLAALACLIITLTHLSAYLERKRRERDLQRNSGSNDSDDETNPHLQGRIGRVIAGRLHAIAGHLEAQKHQDRRQDEERATREMITICALIVAGFAAFVSDVILWKQLQDARTAANTQHADTVQALAAAREANKISAESGRPWIAAAGSRLVFPIEDDKPISFVIIFFNQGKSPALSFATQATIEMFPLNEAGDLADWQNPISDVCPATDKLRTGTVVFAGPETPQESAIDVPGRRISYWQNGLRMPPTEGKKVASDIKSKNYVVMVSGCFSYNFGTTRAHTRWCRFLEVRPDKPIEQWPWRDCKNGNDAT